jgi:hypothetical protein
VPQFNQTFWDNVFKVLGLIATIIKLIDWIGVGVPLWLRRTSVAVIAISVLYLLAMQSFGSPWAEIVWFVAGGILGFEICRKVWRRDLPAQQVAYAGKLIGYEYSSLSFEIKVAADGSAVITRRVDVLAYRTVDQLLHYLLVPVSRTPGGALESPEVRLLKRPTDATTIDLVPEAMGQDERLLYLKITPPLNAKDRLEYELLERVTENSIARTSDQLEPARHDNTFGMDISWPTRALHLAVSVPMQYTPRSARCDVWRVPGQVTVEGVLKTTQGLLKTRFVTGERNEQCHESSADVPYPLQGLTYVIRWTPPPPAGGSAPAPSANLPPRSPVAG